VDNTTDLNKPLSTATNTALNLKVDAAGGISTEDYSTAEKTKLAALTGKAVIIPFTSSKHCSLM
jgi:hypothetical protein